MSNEPKATVDSDGAITSITVSNPGPPRNAYISDGRHFTPAEHARMVSDPAAILWLDAAMNGPQAS